LGRFRPFVGPLSLRRRQLTEDGNVETTGRDLREGRVGRLERPSAAQLSSATAIEWAARDLDASKFRRD
jgi:hypothetical protein